jgi:pyruvate-formate lyase-activating enzyme
MRIYDTTARDLARWIGSAKAVQLWRKRSVFLLRLTPRKLLNLAACALGYLGLHRLTGFPVHIKVDVAPSCQLRCPVCPHGSADRADFKAAGLMPVEDFKALVDQAAGKCLAMSLYNLGEPLLHPGLPEMVAYADSHGVNTYITTNLSLPRTPEYFRQLVGAGLGMLIVAVDGVSAETFGRQRIRGDWELVRRNLQLLQQIKQELDTSRPVVVLQYLAFDFNAHERARLPAFARSHGVDELHIIEGSTTPWVVTHASKPAWRPRPGKLLPVCSWPFFSMVVNSNGQISGCCEYRLAQHHVRSAGVRDMGDAKQDLLTDIYRGPSYVAARRLAAAPRRAGEPKGHFCEGCPVLTD